jgi:peptidoglycan/LPS O-acetylase OafA/YrhL
VDEGGIFCRSSNLKRAISVDSQDPYGSKLLQARSSSGSSVEYRPAIDGLRAAAVLAVIIFHLNRHWLPGGFVGVDIFFVISGFLITSILLREYEHKSFTLWKFYQRRIARLFPAFYTVALATIIAAIFLYSAQDLSSCGTGLYTAALFVANLRYMLQGNYFANSPDAEPFLHCWSLSVEEQFYMLFPALLLLLYIKAPRHKTAILTVLCGASLASCIVLTHLRPQWAFYLLPTRAWELMVGSILANLGTSRLALGNKKLLSAWLPLTGLALIAVSLFSISEGSAFPGYLAVIPVLGTVFILGSVGGGSWPEKLLSTGPLALVGRMSYSLYLWHWPIFCFVDYKLYFASPLLRMGLKVALCAAASALCFLFIERPGRAFLNHPSRRRTAFAFLASALVVCVPLGRAVRTANYIDAGARDVAQGGIAFNQASKDGSVVLMGDSDGSMYGKMVKGVAQTLHLKLNVISVAGEDALPQPSGTPPKLWLDSLAFVKRDNPDALVLACDWERKLFNEKGRLEIAVNELKQHTRRLILITQPPILPESGSRESMRNGSRPPFFENPAERARRTSINAFLKTFQHDNVIVVDIEPLFIEGDGSIRFVSDDGHLLYYDGYHLSATGADLVKPDLVRAIKN